MSSGSNKTNESLCWAQAPLRELGRLAWPITVSMLSYAVMTLVDTLFVGRLGPAALAGVGLGGTAVFVLLCFSLGLLRGTKVLVSQARGAGDEDSVRKYLGAALLLAVGLGVAALAAGFAVAEVLPRLAATAEAGHNATAYFRVRMLSAPVLFVAVAMREVRYGLGDARWPMTAAVSGNVFNVFLDYVLIYEFGMGVEGAAWATTIAHGLEAAVLAAVQAKHGFGVAATRVEHVAAVWRIGAPTGAQFMLEVGSFAVVAAMLARLSELDMAAHLIALQVVHFSFLPGMALGDAASVMVGEAIGARRGDLVRPVSRLALKAAVLYCGACGVVFFVFGEALAAAFTEEAALVLLAGRLLLVAAVFQVFDAANIVARCVLRGVGDVRYPAVICIVIAWGLTPPLTWLLGYVAGLGALGAWVGLCAEIIVGSLVLWWRLETGAWQKEAERTRDERERVASQVALAS